MKQTPLRRKAKRKAPGHGGARAGAGRKPTVRTASRTYQVDAQTEQLLADYRQARGLPSTSAALRELVALGTQAHAPAQEATT